MNSTIKKTTLEQCLMVNHCLYDSPLKNHQVTHHYLENPNLKLEEILKTLPNKTKEIAIERLSSFNINETLENLKKERVKTKTTTFSSY